VFVKSVLPELCTMDFTMSHERQISTIVPTSRFQHWRSVTGTQERTSSSPRFPSLAVPLKPVHEFAGVCYWFLCPNSMVGRFWLPLLMAVAPLFLHAMAAAAAGAAGSPPQPHIVHLRGEHGIVDTRIEPEFHKDNRVIAQRRLAATDQFAQYLVVLSPTAYPHTVLGDIETTLHLRHSGYLPHR